MALAAGAPAPPISCVFFDCGSTLIDPCPSVAEQFVIVANRRGHDLTIDEVSPHMPLVDRYYETEYLKDGSFWVSPNRAVQLWHDIYRLMCRLTGLTADAEGMASEMFASYLEAENWMVYPDVVPALHALKERGLMLAVVSNWDPGLADLMRGLKLLPYFDEVVASAAVGYRKPDPLIFQLACERLDAAPACCVHVGDNVEADVQGALDAGVIPCLLDRSGRLSASERADMPFNVIDRLTEVLSLPEIAPEGISSC